MPWPTTRSLSTRRYLKKRPWNLSVGGNNHNQRRHHQWNTSSIAMSHRDKHHFINRLPRDLQWYLLVR